MVFVNSASSRQAALAASREEQVHLRDYRIYSGIYNDAVEFHDGMEQSCVFGGSAADFGAQRNGASGVEELPAPEMRNLSRIATMLQDVGPFVRDRVAEQALAPNYLRRLLDLFRVSGVVMRCLSVNPQYACLSQRGRLADGPCRHSSMYAVVSNMIFRICWLMPDA